LSGTVSIYTAEGPRAFFRRSISSIPSGVTVSFGGIRPSMNPRARSFFSFSQKGPLRDGFEDVDVVERHG
jgi:hypothetical protein